MGEGWHSDFGPTHFDFYSPPDFRVEVITLRNIFIHFLIDIDICYFDRHLILDFW